MAQFVEGKSGKATGERRFYVFGIILVYLSVVDVRFSLEVAMRAAPTHLGPHNTGWPAPPRTIFFLACGPAGWHTFFFNFFNFYDKTFNV